MSQSDSENSYSLVEHNRFDQRRTDRYDRDAEIRSVVEKCARALERGQRRHYYFVATKLADELHPVLLDDHTKTAEYYNAVVGTNPEFDYTKLTQFRENEPAVIATVADDSAGPLQADLARACIEKAFYSTVAIAEFEEIIRDELRTRVDATIFDAKIGEHLQDAKQDLGDEVEAISLLSGALKTIHTGGTGQGKSAGVETEAETYYRQNFRDGRDFKIIDPVGLRDGENWFYDIPLQEPRLRRSREEQNLPPSFAEDPDRDPETYPDLEILVPLTPGLTERELPFDVDEERFTVRPFTIPAAGIRKRLLVSVMSTKLTPEQENIVRSAYNAVDNRIDDWTLAELAEEVRSREELSEQKRRPILDTLQSLQNQGFIRTHDHEHTLDWDRIFSETETITIFSQAFVEDTIAQLIAVGDTIETIVTEREQRYGIAECLLVIREMWKIAPHNRRQSFDERAAALQEAIAHMLTELFRENRHSGVHLSCDTQYLSDLLKAIRELFNRYCVYRTNRATVKDVFEWTANDKWKSFYGTLTPTPGEASIVGMVQPALDERGIEFLGPIDYAGASHHHFNETRDHNGWAARADYFTPTESCPECDSAALDRGEDRVTLTCQDCGEETVDLSLGRCEQLRTPAEVGVHWDDEVPTKLMVETGYEEDSSPDVDYEPVAVFAEECLRYDDTEAIQRQRVRTAFNEFMADHDRERRDFDDDGVVTRFGKRLGDTFEDWDKLRRTTRDGKVAYGNLTLTARGQQYLDDAMEGFEDAAAPIRGDD